MNTASINTYDPSEVLFDYAATKAAIALFTNCLAKQLSSRAIRVNAVAPSPYWTPLQHSGGQPPDKLPHFGANTPLGRPGQPAEIAPLYVLLASDESPFTSGEVFASTGGRPAKLSASGHGSPVSTGQAQDMTSDEFATRFQQRFVDPSLDAEREPWPA